MKTFSYAFFLALFATGVLVDNVIAKDFWIAAKGSNCQVWTDKAPVPNEAATWSGGCKGGKAAGQGTLAWRRGGTLIGTYEGYMENGRFNGPGALRVTEKPGKTDQVEGFFRNGVVSGGAIFKEADGDVYMGELKHGKPNGAGYAKRAHEEYTGDFVDGKRDGIGLLISGSESYLGEFEKDKANGSGVLQDAEGGRFHGQFKNGKPNGAGTYVTANGATYQGTFKNGKANGLFLVKKSEDAKPVVETWKDGRPVQ